MFKRQPQNISNLLNIVLRNQGLETPLQQRRLVQAWDEVISETFDAEIADIIIANTGDKEIKGQTLWVQIMLPALRSDLQMRASQLITQLNAKVGTQLIIAIRFH